MGGKQAVLFTGGEGPEKKYIQHIIDRSGIIVAADSGLDLALEYRIEPYLVVGDMDSVQNSEFVAQLPEERKMVFSVDKDETDTEIGLHLLYERGFTRVAVIGGGGGRIDHFIGIFSLFFKDRRPSEWYTHEYQIICIDRPVEIHGKVGATVSFFPASREECRMVSTGLRWQLDKLVWHIGDCGISNILTESSCRIVPREGRLMLVAHLQEELVIE